MIRNHRLNKIRTEETAQKKKIPFVAVSICLVFKKYSGFLNEKSLICMVVICGSNFSSSVNFRTRTSGWFILPIFAGKSVC